MGWRKALAPFALLVFILSCQPLAPPEKLVGQGVVQKVVAGDRRVVIAHDDIPGFMRAMTMSFEVRNPALLEQLAPGERVRFTLEKTKETLYLVAVSPTGLSSPSPATRERVRVRASLIVFTAQQPPHLQW